MPLPVFYERKKTVRVQISQKGVLDIPILKICASSQNNKSRKKQTGFLKWVFNIRLLFLGKILASYRLPLLELLYRISCCNIHTLKHRIVYRRSGMEKGGLLPSKDHLPSMPPGIIFHWQMCKYSENFEHALNFNW